MRGGDATTAERLRMPALVSAPIGAGVVVWYWWTRTHPAPCPYAFRFSILIPRPLLSRKRLARLLEPAPGERMLEVGPGTGAYTFETAGALGSAGRLDVLDVQEKMLAHTMRAAGRLGLDNIVPEQGDAGTLPYDDDSFDAAYLITVLGEIGDQDAALRELRRVLKPGGRLVVGEIALDPDWISLGTLRQQTSAASLRYDCHIGNTLSYLARFRAD